MSEWHSSDEVSTVNLNTKNVLTGDIAQNIDGVKTFLNFPVGPSAGPTEDYELCNKWYVDNYGGGGGGVPLDLRGWSFDATFSATDYNTVAWTGGTLTFSDGATTYSILAGNTGNMGTTTYIYFDQAISHTTLQKTTTASNATGVGKVLIAVANPVVDTTKSAEYQAYGGVSGGVKTIVTADVIAANTITGNEVATNTLTASHIVAGSMDISVLDFVPLYSTSGVNDVIATINASSEGLNITADRINIAGTTTFTSGWASASNAESDINALNTTNGPADAGATDDTVANQALADAATAIANAATAQSTADGKVVSFYQDSAPTADGTGDFWIDTNDNNKLYRWNGSSWISVQDGSIADAQSDATTAIGNAASAQATADGKITTFYQASPATADDAGDIWVDTDDGNRVYIATAAGSGSWVAVADITANNTAADADAVGGLASSIIASWSMTGDETKVNGGLMAVGSQLTVGTGNNVGVLSGSNATYRIWAGHNTAASAPFRVTQAGVMYCSGATINGDVSADEGIKTQAVSSNYTWLYYRSNYGEKRHTLDFWSNSSWVGGIYMDTNSTAETKIDLYKYGVSGEGLRAAYNSLEIDGSGSDQLVLYSNSITMSGSQFIDSSRNLTNIGTITNSGLIDCGNYIDAASGFKVNGNTIVDSDRKAYLYDIYIASGSAIYNNGLRVVGARQSHIADADGTLADLTAKFNTLLSYLDADAGHGLLAGA